MSIDIDIDIDIDIRKLDNLKYRDAKIVAGAPVKICSFVNEKW